jgi:FKBP-type peptidyl-prolyl cis-trans isomerase FklB
VKKTKYPHFTVASASGMEIIQACERKNRMKFYIATMLGIGLLAGTVSAEDKPADKSALKDEKQRVSYSVGVSLGSNWKMQDLDFDIEALTKGMKDAIKGGELLLTEKEMGDTLMNFKSSMKTKMEEKAKVAGEKNKKEGESFLAANAKKEGVKTLPSGLQYKVLKEGTGDMPKATDRVSTNYKGTLIDGTEFDSSYKRGEPATFGVNGVIKGWTEALQLMKTGAKWQLFVPSNLAYGESGAAPQIAPNATLIFEVELLKIEKE